MSEGAGPSAGGVAGRVAAHALAKPGARADQPWDGDHVAKVSDEIFAFLGAIAEEVLLEAVDASYDLVVAKLPRSRRPTA